jgi:hypothetical protein
MAGKFQHGCAPWWLGILTRMRGGLVGPLRMPTTLAAATNHTNMRCHKRKTSWRSEIVGDRLVPRPHRAVPER